MLGSVPGGARIEAGSPDDRADAVPEARASSWPLVVALPLCMLISFVVWWAKREPAAAPLPITTWLLLCLAGAAAPFTTFALALRLSGRVSLVDEPSWSAVRVNAAAVAACIAVEGVLEHIVAPRSPIAFRPAGFWMLAANGAISYVIVMLVIQGIRSVRESRRNEAARVRLRRELGEAARHRAEAELRALKAELNPHFLGNALQSVKALMRTDIEAADGVLAPLGDVLRDALARGALQETTLRDELASLAHFVEVERARLRGRLDIDFDIADETLNALVPDLILQPLVENAVKHGLVPFGGGRVRVSARRANHDASKLRLVVEDDGVALGAVGTTRAAKTGGVGLANVRARLVELYGDGATLDLRRGGLGTCAVIDMPWRDADDAGDVLEVAEQFDPADDARAAATVVPFGADSVMGRLRRIAIAAATIAAWYVWARNDTESNMLHAIARGLDDKRGYAIGDGILCATYLTWMLHCAGWVARRWQLGAAPDRKWHNAFRPTLIALAGVALCGLGFIVLKIALLVAFDYRVLMDLEHLRRNAPRSLMMCGVIFMTVWLGAQCYYAARRGYRARNRRRRLSQEIDDARHRRAAAELRALKSELNPHFIGNAFTAVSVLMRRDPEAAARVIDQLSDLLRSAVDRAGTQEVTLREEIDSLQPFLDVERVRLGRELAVRLDIEDEALGLRVPHMILQPLVENAVKHGLAARGGGHIEVSAHRSEAFLELSIRDDGRGLADVADVADVARKAPVDPHRGGVGLANARARLTRLYGQSATLELFQAPEGGAVARVLIPWRDDEAVAAPHSRFGTFSFTRPASAADAAGSP